MRDDAADSEMTLFGDGLRIVIPADGREETRDELAACVGLSHWVGAGWTLGWSLPCKGPPCPPIKVLNRDAHDIKSFNDEGDQRRLQQESQKLEDEGGGTCTEGHGRNEVGNHSLGGVWKRRKFVHYSGSLSCITDAEAV